jgi:clathrin heavy chain
VTNRNGLFKHQARYLVERKDLDLWAKVLTEENENRRTLIDQVVGTALPESKDSDEVSLAVRAFMTADLPHELLELLEKIVLQSTSFSDNKNLQNLILMTAIKADASRVMDYIKKLENFDGPPIAGIAIDAGLFEEAFFIYKKFDQKVEAITVLLTNLEDLTRGQDFAKHCNDPEVWSVLAAAQLKHDQVTEAIESYVKANDASNFQGVIEAAEKTEHYAELIKFLMMARKKVKDQSIDSILIFSYAKTNRLSELEEFISGPNVAKIQGIGDRCFDEGYYEAARLLFTNISNFSRLASALVKLKKFQDAVEAARKANSTRTWKEVLEACVDATEFRLAQMCGLQIIMNADDIEEVVRVYEVRGYFEELLQLMESGLGLEIGAGQTGIFTELGVLYSKYKPDKMMEHLKLFWSRCNLPRLIRAAERARMWSELTFAHVKYDEFDTAAHVMIDHSPEAWDHTQFKDCVFKVNNTETYYKAIRFYQEHHPELINDILNHLVSKLDHSRVVDIAERADNIALIKGYLQGVQKEDISEVNEALNNLYVEEEDYDALRQSVFKFKTFDQIALAEKVQRHDVMEFRRIAAELYKANERWAESIDLSKADKLYKDAMETAAQSKNNEMCEGLLEFFVDENLNSCFGAALFMCYDYIRADVVLELAWRYGILDYSMPFFVQFIREYVSKVDTLWDEREKSKKQAEKDAAEAEQAMGVDPSVAMTMGLGDQTMYLTAPGYGYDAGMQGGYAQQGMMQQGMGMQPGMMPQGYQGY